MLDRLDINIDEKDKVTDKTLEKVVHLTSEFQRYMSLSHCARITPSAFDSIGRCVHLRECKYRVEKIVLYIKCSFHPIHFKLRASGPLDHYNTALQ